MSPSDQTHLLVKEAMNYQIDSSVHKGEEAISLPIIQPIALGDSIENKGLSRPHAAEYELRGRMCIETYKSALKNGFNEKAATDLGVQILEYMSENSRNLGNDFYQSPPPYSLPVLAPIPLEKNKFQQHFSRLETDKIIYKKKATAPHWPEAQDSLNRTLRSLTSRETSLSVNSVKNFLKKSQRILLLTDKIKVVSRKIASGVHSILELIVTAFIVPFILFQVKKKGAGSKKFIECAWEAIKETYDQVKKNPAMQLINILLDISIFLMFILQAINPVLIPIPASLVTAATITELMTTLIPAFYNGYINNNNDNNTKKNISNLYAEPALN